MFANVHPTSLSCHDRNENWEPYYCQNTAAREEYRSCKRIRDLIQIPMDVKDYYELWVPYHTSLRSRLRCSVLSRRLCYQKTGKQGLLLHLQSSNDTSEENKHQRLLSMPKTPLARPCILPGMRSRRPLKLSACVTELVVLDFNIAQASFSSRASSFKAWVPPPLLSPSTC